MLTGLHGVTKVPQWVRSLTQLSGHTQGRKWIQEFTQSVAGMSMLLLWITTAGYAQMSTEHFSQGIPSTWTQFQSAGTNANWQATTDGYQGSAVSITPTSTGTTNSARQFLVTPLINVPANGELRFYSKRGSDEANAHMRYSVMISTAAQPDINGFTVELAGWSGGQLNTGSDTAYEEKIVSIPSNIPAGMPIYIAFVATNSQAAAQTTGDTWFVDNVRLIPTCLPVIESSITYTGIGTTQATVNWNSVVATSFDVQVVPQGDAPLAQGTHVVGNTYTFTDLTENTAYDFYIRAYCDAETGSVWAGPFSFTTLRFGMNCASPIVIQASAGSPYFLAANINEWPNATLNPAATHAPNCLTTASNENYLAGNRIHFTYTPTEDGVITIDYKNLPWSSGTQCFGNSNSGVFIYDNCSSIGSDCLAGLNVTSSNQLRKIENFPVVAGTTYTLVITTSFQDPTASICFEFGLSFSDCPAPNGISFQDLTQSGATFSWNNPVNMATQWEYAAVPAGSGEPTSWQTTNAPTFNAVTGLTAGTAYDFYVRGACDGTMGSWATPYTFTTLCEVFTAPYSTPFEGYSATNPAPCWTSLDVNNDGIKWTYMGGWEDGYLGYASLQTNSNQNTNHDYLASPQVHFDGVTQKRLRFAHQVTGGVSSYSIRLSTTGVGASNYTVELVPETAITNSGWQEVIYNIPLEITGDVSIAWVVSPVGSGHTATRVSLTNVFIEDKPACPDPLSPALVDGSVTATSAQFTWAAGESETQWEVLALPFSAGMPDASTSGLLVTDHNPYTFENLDPAKRYQFFVRAYCSEEHQSNWIGPVHFITSCIEFTTPFYESFNDTDDSTQKFCWTIENANADASQWNMGEEFPTIQGSTLWFNPTTGYDDWIISPAISGTGLKELKYSFKALQSPFFLVSRYGIQVMISHTDNNLASFEELVPLEEFTNTDFLERRVYFEATGTFYIAFRVPPHFSIPPGTSQLNLDEIFITDAPDCPLPSALAVSGVMQNTAQITWTAGFAEDAWEVAIVPNGSGLPTSGTNVSSTTYSPTDLTAGTAYEVYVRATCSADAQSEWIGPVAFTTLCEAYSTPFIETFEPSSATEYCWRTLNVNNDNYSFVTNITSYPYEGNETAGMFTGSNGANDDWLISPTINVQEGQRLRFQYRTYTQWYTEDLQVRLSTTGIAPAQFDTVLFDTETASFTINNNYYKEMVINIPAGVTGPVNFAWHIPTMPGGPDGYRGQIIMIDYVVVEDIPACADPYNVTLNDITDTSVAVNWEVAGTESTWEVMVQPHGLPAPGVTAVADYIHTASAHPFVVTDLDPATKYDVYVRAVCSDENSNWTSVSTFNTLCSFENLCEYTITLSGAGHMGVGGGINVIQNGVVVQTLEFPTGAWYDTMEPVDFIVFLCTGVEFTLFWDSIGTAPGQYPGATVTVTNSNGEVVSTTDLGELAVPRSNFFTGIAACGEITCPQPTDLAVSPTQTFSWTAGGSETAWEVAVQPYANGTLPTSGTVVDTPSYQLQDTDLALGTTNTFEYFVRALCEDGSSYWSGPFVFVVNDDASTATVIIPSEGDSCTNATSLTLNNASSSTDAMSCDGQNGGDVWFQFEATSDAHLIEINNFEGDYYYDSGNELYAQLTMVLYEAQADGSLTEIACSYNNAMATLYSTALTVGSTYKIRVVNTEEFNSTYRFDICVKTITDPCNFAGINGGFEDPKAPIGFSNMLSQKIVPGWRFNLQGYWSNGAMFFLESLNTMGITPYEGGQLIQMFSSESEGYTLDMNNIDGLYQDFDSSEITAFDYSFAHGTRGGVNTLKLFAGAPGGPFTEVTTSTVSTLGWQLREGTYQVPEGQTTTRFVFRSELDEIGNTLDAIRITNNNKISILTEQTVVECGETLALEASGVGTWSVDENNPGEVLIADVNSRSTVASHFTQPGEYTFYWRTRYCEEVLVVTYNGFGEVATVTTPVNFCQNQTASALTATAPTGFTLAYYTEAVGGTAQTEIIPSTAAVGTTTYYVALVDANGCEGPRVALEVVVSPLQVQNASFTYESTTICALTEQVAIQLGTDFTTGGTFSVSPTTGLTVDALTGALSLAQAQAGTYEITYTLAANGCHAEATHTVTVTIEAAQTPTFTFNYESDVCALSTEALTPVTSTGWLTGGTFTSSTLTIDATTGVITAPIAAGSHTITYTLAANEATCTAGVVLTTVVNSTAASTPEVGFSFDAVYCVGDEQAFPDLVPGFVFGGTFQATSGLVIDPNTGEINLTGSTAGTHTVTYSLPEDATTCTSAATLQVTLTLQAATELIISQICEDGALQLQVDGNSSYTWIDAQGQTVATNTNTLNVSEYLAAHPQANFPLYFEVVDTASSCDSFGTYTLTNNPCGEIPRGISPNDDGFNDAFDLTGMNVVKLQIFNRYGQQVYQHAGTYTNQWNGQSDNGDELPTATYFYLVTKSDGSTVTGWVYIIR